MVQYHSENSTLLSDSHWCGCYHHIAHSPLKEKIIMGTVSKISEPRDSMETLGQKIVRLQTEAKQLAADHVIELQKAMSVVEDMAKDISEGGEAYLPGVRDLARKLMEDMEARSNTLEAIGYRMK